MIEVILGVNIILSMFIIVALLIGSNKASHIKRIKIEEGNRIIYCVMQEIKYNMTINELIGKENIISFSLKYNEKFLENLINTSIKDMEKGKEIVITTNKINDESVNVNISYKLPFDNEIIDTIVYHILRFNRIDKDKKPEERKPILWVIIKWDILW